MLNTRSTGVVAIVPIARTSCVTDDIYCKELIQPKSRDNAPFPIYQVERDAKVAWQAHAPDAVDLGRQHSSPSRSNAPGDAWRD
jgi:hypothetical protein